MAMRKVGRSACLRICYPIFGRLLLLYSLITCVVLGLKLFSAGPRVLLLMLVFNHSLSCWVEAFFCRLPRQEALLFFLPLFLPRRVEAFSACSPSVFELVFFLFIICLSGWKLFSASSLEDCRWHFTYIAIDHWLCSQIHIKIHMILGSLSFYGMAVGVLCSFGGSLCMYALLLHAPFKHLPTSDILSFSSSDFFSSVRNSYEAASLQDKAL